MALNHVRRDYVYGMGDNLIEMPPKPIIAQRAPTTSDIALPASVWIDQPNDDVYVLTRVASNSATWINAGGGGGTFNTLTVTSTTTLSALSRGVVQASSTGVLSSSEGTDGQFLIASSAGAPAWANVTSSGGTLVVTNGANTVNLEVSGATTSSFPTDSGTANPALGATTIAGGTSISTSGAGSTVTIDLASSISPAGSITAGVDFTMTSGDCTINGTTDAAQTIYLHANGGTSETIDIYSDQGTGVASVYVHSDVGGLTFASGLASADAINITASDAAGGIDVDYGTGGMVVTGANGAFTVATGTAAINLGADAAAKTITIGNGTGATSVVVDCGTGALNLGTNATAHTTTLGSTTGASSTVVQSGTGDVIITSTDDITVDAAGVVELNSSAGNISVGNDADDYALNLGTGGNRTITVGATGGTSAIQISGGSGNITTSCDGTVDIDAAGAVSVNSSAGVINVGNDAVNQNVNVATAGNRTVTVGATGGTSALALYSGSGNTTVDSDGTIIIDGGGVVEINSDGGNISIASDADNYNLNLGTAGARTVTVGSATAASATVVDCGTGGASFGASANAHTTTIGSTNTTSDTTIQSGTGGITLSAAGIVDMVPATDTQAAAAVTIDANVGVGTFTGLTTAAAGSQVLTVTNSVCTATSAILCTLANKGANDAQCTVTRVVPGSGSFTVTYQNLGAAALNGDLILTFWILAA